MRPICGGCYQPTVVKCIVCIVKAVLTYLAHSEYALGMSSDLTVRTICIMSRDMLDAIEAARVAREAVTGEPVSKSMMIRTLLRAGLASWTEGDGGLAERALKRQQSMDDKT